ncbi:kinesin family member 23 [Mytilus galloprovincialis]|uniref:Kinesin-like protein n=1 Tax=Mytilus galloprovincialis TaxID=29158 RepID=A0A8B6GLF3_MYTGA|nr:kinesin family member 23 [Mytilus galloprovincialis]
MPPQRGKTPKKNKNGSGSQTEPVEVYCRIRPLDNPDDPVCLKAVNTNTCILTPQENAIARNGQVKELQYQFQYVFDEYTSQKAVYDYVAMPLMEDLIKGKNGLLFTYGITSSGKTYTMTGTPDDQGLMPRCLDVLFNSISGLQAKKYVFKPDRMNGFEIQTDADAMMERQRREILPGLTTPKTPGRGRNHGEFGEHGRMSDPTRVEDIDEGNIYAVFVSYIEIYNNYVYDLLEELPHDPITGYKPPQSKILRTDSNDNMYVMNCVEVEIKSPQEAFEVLYKGQKRRKVAHTALNAESSRSHSIFNIRLVQAPLDANTDMIAQVQDQEKNICVSQLSLVDLAGSERTNRTKNTGERMKEAGNINQSLMVLRNCLELLRENQKTGLGKLVPYRDSKLTHLFKNYFDGDGKVRMVVCVNPKAIEYDETIHVMKFAEMTQEVLVTKSQQVKFEILEAPMIKKPPVIEDYIPMMTYSLGPTFPSLEVLHCRDEYTLDQLSDFLDERNRLKENLMIDFNRKQDQFRAQLVKIEKEYNEMKSRSHESQSVLEKRESYIQKLESRLRSLEKRQDETSRQFKECERERRELESKLQDKNMKIRQEKTEKDRLRSDFRNRLEHNNQQWEKNLQKERNKIENELEGQINEKQHKLNMLRHIVNTETDSDTPTARFRTPAPKARTYTTPGKIMSARSETDMSSVGKNPVPTPRSRTQTATVTSARSMHGLNKVGTPKNTPQYNPRHRRSRSSNAEIWLDHRPPGSVELVFRGHDCTVLQPKLKKKKSVSKLEVKDTKEATKYILTHQDIDSAGELETKLIKGNMLPTAGGGTAVVFNDVETLKQISPGSRKRRSSCPQPTDYDGDWTDVEDRCGIAIEGHSRKRSRGTEKVSRV